MTEGNDKGGLGKTMETILGVRGWEKAKTLFLKKSKIREAVIKNINK